MMPKSSRQINKDDEKTKKNKQKAIPKKNVLMDFESDLILMEQIEETRLMSKEVDIDKNYEILA